MSHFRLLLSGTIAAVALTAGACHRKAAMLPPPPPPPVTSPAATPAKAAPPVQAAVRPPAAATPASAPRYPNAATRARIDELLARIEDAYFDYDQADIRPDASKTLQADATELQQILSQYTDYKLTIQGYCDERGSAEYNLGLGDRRGQAAKDYLVQVGIPATQLSIVSYGKERQICAEHNEACWQRNRRIHIVAMAQAEQAGPPPLAGNH